MAPPIDYETLRVIWWALMGVLLIGFALTDGFDLGVASLLPFVAKTDEERRMVINSVGATWEGNQVWFILGGGAIFAAWPFVYAVSFSGFYLAMFLVLAALILRPVGFKYRSKKPDPAWRSRWDWALFVGGFVPALVFGVAVGNVLTGIPWQACSRSRCWSCTDRPGWRSRSSAARYTTGPRASGRSQRSWPSCCSLRAG